jgi:hypothetical protein
MFSFVDSKKMWFTPQKTWFKEKKTLVLIKTNKKTWFKPKKTCCGTCGFFETLLIP